MKLERASLKKSFLKILICAVTVLLLGTVLTACNNDEEGVKFDHLVVFNYNDGYLVDKNGRKESQTLGVFDDSLISIRPGYSSSFAEAKYATYYVAGWYLPMLDEEGNLMKEDKDGNILVEKTDR